MSKEFRRQVYCLQAVVYYAWQFNVSLTDYVMYACMSLYFLYCVRRLVFFLSYVFCRYHFLMNKDIYFFFKS